MKPAELYILEQDEPFRGILLELQILVESTVPEAELTYRFRLPFHDIGGRPFCYMNASRKKGYVDLCFWNSAHLTLHPDKLVRDGRRIMRSLRYFQREEIDGRVAVELLREAGGCLLLGFCKN